MMYFFLRFFLILLGASQLVHASSSFEQGNAAYQAKDYANALTHYQSALQQRPSANVWHNIGNTYHALGDHPRAVHAFRQALRLQPRDRATHHNLAIAQMKLQLPPPNRDLRWATSFLTRNEYAGLTLLAVAWLTAFAWLGHLIPRILNIIFTTFAAIILTASLIAWFSQRHTPHEAIITAAEASIHLSPLEETELLGKATGGSLVHLGKTHDGFVFIEGPDPTKRGWVAKSSLGMLPKW